MHRSFHLLAQASRGLTSTDGAMTRSRRGPMGSFACTAPRRLSFGIPTAWCLIAGISLCACDRSPFTSCVDDTTPCEVTDRSDGVDSHGLNPTIGASVPSASGTAPETHTTAPATSSVDPVSSTPSSPVIEPDAMVDYSNADASVVDETPDASVVPPDDSTSAGPATSDVGDANNGSTSTDSTSEAEAIVGDSLITNGDFASGMSGWKVEQTGGRSRLTTEDEDALCVESSGDVDFTIGWPAEASDSATLERGLYQVSFKVRGVDAEMSVKVGHAYEPYTALHEFTWSSTRDEWERSVSVFRTDGDSATGLAFFVRLEGGSVCLDDVKLSPVLEGLPFNQLF